MTVNILPLLLLAAAIFFAALKWPRLMIFFPLVIHPAYLIRSSLWGIPVTALELALLAVMGGVLLSQRGKYLSLLVPPFLSKGRDRNRVVIHRLCERLKGATQSRRGLKDFKESAVRYYRDCHARNGFAVGDAGGPRRSLPAGGTLAPRNDGGKGRRLLLLAVLVFLAAATVAAIVAPHWRTAWGTWKALIVEPLAYSFLLSFYVKKYAGQRRLAGAIMAGAALSALLSLLTVNLSGPFGRLAGIYDSPNSLAMVVGPALVLAAVTMLRIKGKLQKRTLGILTVFLLGILLLTQSLAMLLGVAFSLGFTYLILGYGQKKLLWTVVLVVVAGMGLQLTTGKLTHLFNPASSSLRSRVQIWRASWELIKDNPVSGTGLGTFEPAYQETLPRVTNTPPLEWVVRDPHNIIFSFWLNTGLAGLLAMLTVAAVTLNSWRGAVVGWAGGQKQNIFPLAFGAALVSLLIAGLFDVPYLKNDLAILWWAYVAGMMRE